MVEVLQPLLVELVVLVAQVAVTVVMLDIFPLPEAELGDFQHKPEIGRAHV